jgi:hypothetical protein
VVSPNRYQLANHQVLPNYKQADSNLVYALGLKVYQLAGAFLQGDQQSQFVYDCPSFNIANPTSWDIRQSWAIRMVGHYVT